MTPLRVGTRGSELALVQTRLVCAMLGKAHPSLSFAEVIISTHGDRAGDQPFDIHWPAGGFVGAIEQALLQGEIDLAVHSYKDLPTEPTPGLTVAAVPPRGPALDVLVTRQAVDPKKLAPGFRVGTGSPRRAAQLRLFLGDVRVVPIRGNVPTRLAKLDSGELDGVVLAAAGLQRLSVRPHHALDLPVERFVPAPGQGALAVQVREGDSTAALLAAIDDIESRMAVDCERAFLRAVGAGCHTPAGAHAFVAGRGIRLTGQLFSDDGSRMVQDEDEGSAADAIGTALARRLLDELKSGKATGSAADPHDM